MSSSVAAGKLTGRAIARVEDDALLRGRAIFVDDMDPPGRLEIAFHRTERAHARVLSVNVAAAAEVPGVVAVLTQADLGGAFELTPDIRRPGVHSPPRPLLAGDRVRFVGEAVALVLAGDRSTAEDAAELVEVGYDDLPAVSDAALAAEPTASRLHEPHSNVLLEHSFDSGGVDAAFAAADLVFDAELDIGRVAAFPMEGRAVLAVPDGDGVTLWTSTQAPHQVKRALEPLLGVHLRVICPNVGGGFGQKAHVYTEEVLAAQMALRFQLPVKWVEDRRENLLVSSHARGQLVKVKVGARGDGTLVALEADFLTDMGAYGVWPHGHILEALGAPTLVPGPYKLGAYRYRTRAVATNKAPAGAYRGVGVAVSAFIHERVIDMVARRLGLDPIGVRRRNLVPGEEMPFTTVVGLQYDSGDYPAAVEQAVAMAGDRSQQLAAAASERGKLFGIGYSSYVETTGMGSEVFSKRGMVGITGFDDARVVLEADGSATLRISLPSAGQGLATSFAQLLGDQLALPLEKVRVAPTDTDEVPDGTGTFGSRSAAAGGPAIFKAAETIVRKAKEVAARHLEVAEWDLEVVPGGIGVRGSAESVVGYAQLVAEAPAGFLDATERYDPQATVFSYGCHACAVEVDPTTGAVEIVDHVVVEDCGPLINPLLAAGQTEGATAQGIGAALLEAVRYSSEGQPLTTTMLDYLLPTAADLPRFRLGHMTHASSAPGGYKGVAEGGTVAAPAAVANAVAAAIGADVNRIPITPSAVLAALASRT